MRMDQNDHAEPQNRLQEPSSFVSRQMIADVFGGDSSAPDSPLSVCFTGHRYIPKEIQPLLTAELDQVLEELYQRGFSIFYNGGAVGFDLLAAERVLLLRDRHTDVQLVMALPCADQTARWQASDVRRYEHILYQANKTHVLSPRYYDGCMQARNRYMVEHSDLCVCYMHLNKGGTASTVAYAMQQGLPVINLAMAMPRLSLRDMELLEQEEL